MRPDDDRGEPELPPGPSAAKRALRAAMPWLAVLGLFVLWEVAVRAFRIPDYLLPAPLEIWSQTYALKAMVGMHTLATLETILYGFVMAAAISLPLAVLVTASPAIASAVYPLLVIVHSIPKVALAPVLVVALGANELPRIAITFLVCFFPLVI
ncbi:MAG: ABC transporter permease, partial [Alphaproteobacteria bacterium]|nr:ABC transporter permease [Alphaproteobacteria bacterium]